MDHLILMVDVQHEDDDGQVSEMDLIEAVKEAVGALEKSYEQRDVTADPMIAMAVMIGDDPKKHGNILIGSAQALSITYGQLQNFQRMQEIHQAGPNLEEILGSMIGKQSGDVEVNGVKVIRHSMDDDGNWIVSGEQDIDLGALFGAPDDEEEEDPDDE